MVMEIRKSYIVIFVLTWATFARCDYNCLNDTDLPETKMSMEELIMHNGYPVENHTVYTSDGYILSVHRIPHGKLNRNNSNETTNNGRQPVLLQHGFVASAVNWIINLPHQSLGYVLADNGYDVWMGNIRGSRYSQNHVNYTRNDPKFWDFSWEDMAEYDLPAIITYILNVTNYEQIVYVAHSQGCLIGFAKFSEDKEFAKKVKLFVALAPVATIGHTTSPFRYIAPLTWTLQLGLTVTGDQSFGDVRKLFKLIRKGFGVITNDQCYNPFFYFSGPGSSLSVNKTRIPLYLVHNPDDTSMKNFVHFGQMINSGSMQKYNYGPWTNYFKYGQLYPPEYKPEEMEVNTVVFWSPQDALTHSNDIQNLLSKLKKVRTFRMDTYRHLDFVLSVDVDKDLYPKVINILKEFCHN